MDWMAGLKPIIVFAVILGFGFIIRKFLFLYLKKITGKTQTQIDDIITDAIKNPFVLWFAILGISIAIKTTNLTEKNIVFADKLLISLWIISFTIVVAKIVSGIINVYVSGQEGAPKMSSITQNAARWIIFGLGILILLNKLGISITPILTALGVGGLAVALALQDTLSNLFAGFHIILTKQIRVDDYVQLDGGQEGFVADVGWRNTRIRQAANNMIIIPNSKLAQAIVINYDIPSKDTGVVIPVGVDYSSDLKKVEAVTVEVARNIQKTVPGAVEDFEPFIRYNAFSNSSIDFSVILRAKDWPSRFLIIHEFIKQLKERYDAERIKIPFPITTVYMKNDE
ncbi:MAG: Small-conductance mechanosensitive channel [Elusimicrobia bacterium ADurb.Bin231]|nr:MAG: Small-conductance mechanosensitive channel [Elusimicrobia bacterium ADurb.Bin231]